MDTADEAEAILRLIGEQPDEEIDLGQAALALGAFDRPRVSLERYRDHLDVLERETALAWAEQGSAEGIGARIAALRAVIADRHGYAGDVLTYDDPQNANLLRVIDRRKGLPVALGILYIGTARRLGWEMVGLNFPGHFLIRIGDGRERAVLDPFERARVCDAPRLRELLKAGAGAEAELEAAHYAPAPNRAVLLRLQNNIKLRRLQSKDVQGALDVVERMLWIAPTTPELVRESALLHGQLGNLGAAIRALERYIAVEPDSIARHKAAALLQELRGKLH